MNGVTAAIYTFYPFVWVEHGCRCATLWISQLHSTLLHRLLLDRSWKSYAIQNHKFFSAKTDKSMNRPHGTLYARLIPSVPRRYNMHRQVDRFIVLAPKLWIVFHFSKSNGFGFYRQQTPLKRCRKFFWYLLRSMLRSNNRPCKNFGGTWNPQKFW